MKSTCKDPDCQIRLLSGCWALHMLPTLLGSPSLVLCWLPAARLPTPHAVCFLYTVCLSIFLDWVFASWYFLQKELVSNNGLLLRIENGSCSSWGSCILVVIAILHMKLILTVRFLSTEKGKSTFPSMTIDCDLLSLISWKMRYHRQQVKRGMFLFTTTGHYIFLWDSCNLLPHAGIESPILSHDKHGYICQEIFQQNANAV